MYREIPEALRRVVEPVVRAHGLALVDVVQRRGPAPWLLRVIVDTLAGDGRVPVEACARLSRELGVHLDAGELLTARYELEVSSPGLSRTLARERDFEAACGKQVKLETRAPIAGRRRFQGQLLAFENGRVRLLPSDAGTDADAVEIPFDEIARGREVYEFRREDFAR